MTTYDFCTAKLSVLMEWWNGKNEFTEIYVFGFFLKVEFSAVMEPEVAVGGRAAVERPVSEAEESLSRLRQIKKSSSPQKVTGIEKLDFLPFL